MIFAKGLLGGVTAVVVVWAIILALSIQRVTIQTKEQGSELVAVAGGWNYLLHKPLVVLLLTAAFGIGLYVTSRISG